MDVLLRQSHLDTAVAGWVCKHLQDFTLSQLCPQPGITTEEIDHLVHHLTVSHGAYPSPLNYRGFPKSVCTSVNNVACHGIPDDRPLQDGDIINIDITVSFCLPAGTTD